MGEGGMKFGGWGGGDYIPIATTVATRMTSALRWTAMRAISEFHLLVRTDSQDSVQRPQPF